MAGIFYPTMLVKKASDQYQASYEEAACLGSYRVDGVDTGVVVAKFIDEGTTEDTVA